MRIITAVLALTLFASTPAFSKKRRSSGKYGPAGCGLGAMLLKGKKGLLFNVLAATLNGSSGNQTFGMSTGTLGCKGDSRVAAINFIETNKVFLANDIAKGEGETVNAFLDLINEDTKSIDTLRSNYDDIFAKNSSSEEIWEKIETVL